MAIRSSGALGVQEILTDINGDVASRADLIGLGVIVGATAGVIGGGDNVIMPGDFYGEDIYLTATQASLSPTAYNFPNTGGDVSITISNLDGVYRVSNVPGWAFATPTYGTQSSTTLILSAGNNSALGSPANASSTVQILGASNAVLASFTILQAGNPVTFDWVGATNYVVAYTAGNVTDTVRAASMFTVAVVSSNTNLATISVGSPTGTNPKDHPVTISHIENFNTGSDEVCQITATGTASQGTISKQISLTQTAYVPITWSDSDLSLTVNDTAGTQNVLFTGATSKQTTSGHDFTITIQESDNASSSPSWISVSPTTGNYDPQNKFGNYGTTSVTLTFQTNTTSSSRTAVVIVEDDESGHKTSLNVIQPQQELSLFDIDSGEADPHILNLPQKADTSFGTFTLQITANTGFTDDWDIQGTQSGTANLPSNTPPRNYNTADLEHRIGTSGTFSNITTALTGNGNATIQVRNPSGYWTDFADEMQYPYYRFQSTSYSSDYSQVVEIKQPKPPIDFDLQFDGIDASQHASSLSGGVSTNLEVYCNTNQISLNVYAVNSAGISVAADIKIVGTATVTSLFTTTTVFPATNGSVFYWSTHPDSTQNAAGRTYVMTLEIENTNVPTAAVTNQQWMNLYVKATSQTQTEGQNSGGYSKLFLKQATGGGGGGPGGPGPGGPGPGGPGGPGLGPSPGGPGPM